MLLILLQLPAGTPGGPVIVQQAASWTTVALAMIGIIPSSIAAIVAGMALLQSRHNAEVAAGTDLKVDRVGAKSDTIIEKATEIHQLTNSNLSRVTQQLEAANVKIAGFTQTQTDSARKIERLETMMEKLAANVVPGPGGGPSPLVGAAPPVPVPVHDAEAVDKLDQLIDQQGKK